MKQKKRQSATAKKRAILKLRPIILKVAGEYGVTNVRVFGSFARGEQTRKSDVDLLVDFPESFSLLDHSGLKIDLEEALGKKVDVVPADCIKPALRKYILADARAL